jgi:hypothetical protein
LFHRYPQEKLLAADKTQDQTTAKLMSRIHGRGLRTRSNYRYWWKTGSTLF